MTDTHDEDRAQARVRSDVERAAQQLFLAMSNAFPGLAEREPDDDRLEAIASDLHQLAQGFDAMVTALGDRQDWDPAYLQATVPGKRRSGWAELAVAESVHFPAWVAFLHDCFQEDMESIQKELSKKMEGFRTHLETVVKSMDDYSVMQYQPLRGHVEERFNRLHGKMDEGFAQLRNGLEALHAAVGTPGGPAVRMDDAGVPSESPVDA